jgi:hypothetical protein
VNDRMNNASRLVSSDLTGFHVRIPNARFDFTSNT